MFSGIIEAKGKVRKAKTAGAVMRVAITVPTKWKLKRGDSVSIDGICSTVVAYKKGTLEFEYMQETLRAATVNTFAPGTVVNLERSLRLGAEMHGHFVQGHVDAVGVVTNIVSSEITIRVPRTITHLITRKGSIAVNGVSLTVSEEKDDTFTVALIPATLEATNVGNLAKGSRVNVETDMFARYIATLLAARAKQV